ncbi:MAG: RimK family alpha-L-glutamate ligase, partial [Candidatus Paceibacterota bacterium]
MSVLIIHNDLSKNLDNTTLYQNAVNAIGLKPITITTSTLIDLDENGFNLLLTQNSVSAVPVFLSTGIKNIDKLFNSLDNNQVKYLNKLQNIRHANDKSKAYQNSVQSNIPVPKTILSTKYEYAFNEIQKHSSYVVVKKLKGFGGSGIHRYKSYDDFLNSPPKIVKPDEELLFQEYISSEGL